MSATAIVHRLRINKFRGLRAFDWLPKGGMNVILGGGDMGKTTVLDALAILFSSTNGSTVTETDYWQRETETDFVIEATVSLPAEAGIEDQRRMAYPWNWNGKEAVQPVGHDGENAEPEKPVYVIRVRGTTDLEPSWEVVQPDGSTEHLSVGVRRQIGLVRLSSDERNDRDLRLVYGSALDRLVADNGLRARIGKQMAKVPLADELLEDSRKALETLNEKMGKNRLPTGLSLGVTSGQGPSIGALIGLLARHEGKEIPLSSWGAGTRRMAALEVAAATAKHASLTTIDEIERGLEPYRLRKLLRILEETPGQVFLTTHSALAIECVGKKGNLWYLDSKGRIGYLPASKIGAQQRRDPETFLAKLAVVGEGKTEVGVLNFLLGKAFGGDPLDDGVRICDGQGNNAVLDLLETMADANLECAGLVDDEGESPDRWKKLKATMGNLLLQWPQAATEGAIIAAVPDEKLEELIYNDEEGLTGNRLRTLADRLGIDSKDFEAINLALAAQKKSLKTLIIEASTGSSVGAPAGGEGKAWKRHGQHWFKRDGGGEELAAKMITLGAWVNLKAPVMTLVNAVLVAVGRPPIADLPT
jgi:putative ATP-dependent endonuclease of OLD family